MIGTSRVIGIVIAWSVGIMPAAAGAQQGEPSPAAAPPPIVKTGFCRFSANQVRYRTQMFRTTLPSSEVERQLRIGMDERGIKGRGDTWCFILNDSDPRLATKYRESWELAPTDLASGWSRASIDWQPDPNAKPPEPERKSTMVRFGTITDAQLGVNGYPAARIRMDYDFINCMGEVHMAYSLVPAQLDTGDHYVFNRQTVPVGSDAKPAISGLAVRGKIMRKQDPTVVRWFKDVNTGPALGFGCFTGQIFKVGLARELVGTDTRPDALARLLSELVLVDAVVDPYAPLRNSSIEARLRAGTHDEDRAERATADQALAAERAKSEAAVGALNAEQAAAAKRQHEENLARQRAFQADADRIKSENAAAEARHRSAVAEYERLQADYRARKAEADAMQKALDDYQRQHGTRKPG